MNSQVRPIQWLIVLFVGAFALSGCKTTDMNMDGMMASALTIGQAVTITDADVEAQARLTIAQNDAQNRVAGPNTKYVKRLNRLTAQLKTVDGHQFNYKVYVNPEYNAFVTPDGSIRLYSGLFDGMSDDEIRFIIGHEIGHKIHSHGKEQRKVALTMKGLRTAGASSGHQTVSAISLSEIGEYIDLFVNQQYSQSAEHQADDYGFEFMKRNGYDPKSAASALRKLEARYGNKRSIVASHPASGDRAVRLEQRLNKNS